MPYREALLPPTLLILGRDVFALRKHVVSHGNLRGSMRWYPLSCIINNLLHFCIAAIHLTVIVVIYARFESYLIMDCPVPATVMRLSAERKQSTGSLRP